MTNISHVKPTTGKGEKIGCVRPCLTTVLSFGKGELPISASTMNLMMFVSPYVDLDGRIILDMAEVRQRLFVQHKTFHHALYQALEYGLIYEKEGYYYSNFHIHSTGDSEKAEYLKLLEVYTSPTLLNYSLNKKRLFYYFASVTTLGVWQRISIENMYKNELRHKEHGVKYFSSFKEMADSLLTLIQDGLLEVKLLSLGGMVLDSSTPCLEDKFNAFFNVPKGVRKPRISSTVISDQVISVRVSPNLITEKEMEVIASQTELHELAESYMLDWTELRSDTINFIIGCKNDLYHHMGDTGVSIYRKALHAYISEFGPDILYYDLEEKKATTFFVDLYLIPAIRSSSLTKS